LVIAVFQTVYLSTL